MKKLCSILLLGAVLFTGCSKKAADPVSAPAPVPSEAPAATPSPSEFYTAYTEDTARPIAVMVDNDNKDAWPHAGLSDAYLIYEVPVEGGATRLMALFGSHVNTEKIGPVRSSRHYFLDFALEHDAIYTHFGYSPRAMSDIPALGVNNINGVIGSDSGTFWRETKYVGDYHSAFTSIEKIKATTERKGYRTERQSAPLVFAENEAPLASGTAASNVKIPYAGFYSVGFTYEEATGTYTRLMNGAAHPMQGGARLVAKNIIIMQMKTYPLGDGSARINVETTAGGKGYYITLGKCIPITWEKSGRSGKTVWKDESGQEIRLNPGQTFVELLPSGVTAQIG